MNGVVVTDPQLRIIRINQAFCALTGFDPAELVNRGPPYRFWTELEADRAMRQMREATIDGGDFELMLCRKDGRLVEAVVLVSPVHDSGGNLVAHVSTYEDRSGARSQERLERTMRSVAAAAAAARDDPQAVFDQVALHLAELVSAPAVAIVRFEGDRGIIVGARAHPLLPLPEELPFSEPSASATVAATGRSARHRYDSDADGAFASRARAAGMFAAVAVPVRLGNTLWGCLAAMYDRPEGTPDGSEQWLEGFADLVSLALVNADAWSRLQRRATTDGLTGLLNHRAFYERLAVERRRALRHQRSLALAVFDVDGLKGLNDTRGHQAGDLALQTVSRALASHARAEDVAARHGGDEFALITPDTDAAAALVLAERLRADVAEALSAVGMPLTLSCGVSDLSFAPTVDDLVLLADGALYHAKRHGRDQAALYTPDVVTRLSYEDLLGDDLLSAAEAINHAVASKNGTARAHAEHVARVAEHIAARLGWDSRRRAKLREAALLHDVGKLAIPETTLNKPGAFTPEEYEQVKPHVTLGAQIAEGVLDEEQLRWLRAHHERPDGRGYPDGLHGPDIPDGAQVLAVADAYDAMTRDEAHHPPRAPADAVDEFRRCARTQFDPAAVDALADWITSATTAPPPVSDSPQ